MKSTLISKYRTQLEESSDQMILIPSGFEDEFWDWFENKSKIFDLRRVRKRLRKTNIPILDNFCYKNTYRIAKGFVKRLYYYEGFSYTEQKGCVKHAFNVCKYFKVNDYTLIEKLDDKQDYYIGVKIRLAFAKKIYKEIGEGKFTQYSLLVPYFMYLKGLDDYLQYTEL
jgi:hypothetical protein